MDAFGRDEVRSALRNREMPLEALALDVTPVGMHYVLAHYDIPIVDASSWRLEIGGLVERPTALDLEALTRIGPVEEIVTLECAGNGRALMSPRHPGHPWHLGGVSTAAWTGVRLHDVLERAGPLDVATHVALTGADEGVEEGVRQRYAWGLELDEALRPEVLLAFGMDGRPLEPQHGAPVRCIVPGRYGMASVKWLDRIEVLDRAFEGPQHAAYRVVQGEDDPGAAIGGIVPRAVMVPPGVPDDDGTRVVDGSSVHLVGRAWSGRASVTTVEVALDAGPWRPATLGPPVGRFGWKAWSATVHLGSSGTHELRVRATDAGGETQPDEPPWNLWGYVNNAVQRVIVRSG